MADDPQDDVNSSQPGDQELEDGPVEQPSSSELSDEHDAVATGFSVDESGSHDFDGDSAEYEAVADERPADEDDDHDDVLDPAMYDGGAPTEEETFDAPTDDEDEASAGDLRQPPLQSELEAILDAPAPRSVDTEPLPEVGPYLDPAMLTLWVAGEQQETFAVAHDKLLIGRADRHHADADSEVPSVDVDLGAHTDDKDIWRRHAALYRHNKNYTLYVTSDAETQLNDEPLGFGEHRRLEDGDLVIFGHEVGLEFSLPDSQTVTAEAADVSEPEFEEDRAVEPS